MFKNIHNKRFDKIEELSKKSNYGDLEFTIQSSGQETDLME